MVKVTLQLFVLRVGCLVGSLVLCPDIAKRFIALGSRGRWGQDRKQIYY